MLSRESLPWSRHLSRPTPWHRADPRIRLMVTLLLSFLALASHSWPEILLLYICLAVLYSLSRTAAATAWTGFRPFAFLLLFTALLQIFLTPGRPLPFSGGLVTHEGLLLSAVVLLRLSAVILLSTHLISTTSPLELSRSLGWAISPGRHFGLPVADFVLLLNLGFQFFPLLLEESQALRQALESRGISLRHPRFLYRLQALSAWILALLSSVLERSQRLAMALEMKNFGHQEQLRLRFPPWRRESTVTAVFALVSLFLWSGLRLIFPAMAVL
jgi:energy-coupling factor transport system permease protein